VYTSAPRRSSVLARNAGRDHLMRRKFRDIDPIENDAACAGRREPENGADQCGLAGPVRAEKTGDAAGLDREGNILEDVGAVIGRIEILNDKLSAHDDVPR